MSRIKGEITIAGVQFGFVRRRYPGKTFTWLHYRDENDEWQEYRGDPWPSIQVPRKDLVRIAEELKKPTEPC